MSTISAKETSGKEPTTKPYPSLITRGVLASATRWRMKDALELDADDVAYLSKAVSQVFRTSVIREATNVNFVRLSGAEFNTGVQTKRRSDNEKKAQDQCSETEHEDAIGSRQASRRGTNRRASGSRKGGSSPGSKA